MRGLVAAAGLVALVCAILVGGRPASAKETQEYTSGQWTGFSYTNDSNGQFTDCTVWAFNRDNVQVGISVKKDWTLQFWLNSKTWNLPSNQSYPVSYWVDRNAQYSGKAAVSSAKFAYVDVDKADVVFNELKQGSQLTFRTSAADYVFELTGSRQALSQLLDCVDRYAKASTSNPFGGGDQGTQPSQPQPDNNKPQSNGGYLKSFSLSPDDVQKFLVDVTGAKPSMVTVTPKTSKAGSLTYNFSTPLGGGEFWQETLDTDSVQDVALSYLDDYKSDCKAGYVQSPNDPIKGKKGVLATGTATCDNSPYQDNGPEILSYSMSATSDNDNVVSIFMTYAGGNAAKTKTDALGKLIAKRSEELLQE